jgi:hypothetical protein
VSFLENLISVEWQSQSFSVFAARLRVKESVLHMKPMYKALTFCSLAMLVFALSCGHPMTLESITILPTSDTVTGTGPALANFPVKFTAYGHFISPTEQVDISNDVTWTSDVPLIATVDSTGVVTATGNGSCGTVLITATAHKGVVGPGTAQVIVIGTATFTVNDTSNPNCGGTALPTLAVIESGTGTGNVVSSPVGINCTSNSGVCSASFAAGTLVTLTATPTGTSTFGAWSSNCTVTGANTCQVSVGSSLAVTAAFN